MLHTDLARTDIAIDVVANTIVADTLSLSALVTSKRLLTKTLLKPHFSTLNLTIYNMVQLTRDLKARIAELRLDQQQEVINNFANGDLWNNCEDAIFFIERYGQENRPAPLYDEDDCECGYELNDGTKVYFEGMTFENSY
jgi:hypothetical protein